VDVPPSAHVSSPRPAAFARAPLPSTLIPHREVICFLAFKPSSFRIAGDDDDVSRDDDDVSGDDDDVSADVN